MRARDNPFSTDRVLQLRYEPQGASWESLLERLAALEYRAAIVGPHGSGKTTMMEDLVEKLEPLGFHVHLVRINMSSSPAEKTALLGMTRKLGARDFLLLDGAEQLSWLQWLILRIRACRLGGLLISVHRPCRLPTLWKCETSPELLAGLIARLDSSLDAAGIAKGLFAKHRGNLREALRELYDRAAMRS